MNQQVIFGAFISAVVCSLAISGLAIAGEAEWVSLFDGKTLAGWHQEGDGDWIVEEGAIVGKTQKAAKLYGLLVSDDVYRDFTLRLKFKSLQGNSGFYIRMVVEQPDKAHGLQIEVDPRHNSGGIYESYRRAWVSQPSKEKQREYFKPDQWNDLEITAHGGNVTVKVNGVTSAQITNDPSRPAGQLAMQMHAGNKMMVMFKDIEIRPIAMVEPEKLVPTKPARIQPNQRGELVLSARAANVGSDQPAYLPAWDALVFSSDTDQTKWNLSGVETGVYEVSLEWSATPEEAGKPLVLTVGSKRLESKIESTGSTEVYQIKHIGRITIDKDAEDITLQAPPFRIRELRLVPHSK